MTQAQNGEFSPSDLGDAQEVYWRAKLSDPRELFMDWFERTGVAALRFSEPIDILDVGTGGGELICRVLQTLIKSGIQVRSVTCVEPDLYALDGLDYKVLRMDFPDTSFHFVPAMFEEFSPTDQIPTQFHLLMASHVYPYLCDPEFCFELLSDKLLRPNGRTIITTQMPVGMWAVIQELCHTPGWLYKDHILLMHMGVLQEWAHKSRVRSRLDVLWGDGIDVSACFTDSREGQLILSVLVAHSLFGCARETLDQAREALKRHSHSLRTEPTKRILPDPFGVLVVFGKE